MNCITVERLLCPQDLVARRWRPGRALIAAVAAAIAVLVSTAAPLCADRAAAVELVQEAIQLLDQGKNDEASE